MALNLNDQFAARHSDVRLQREVIDEGTGQDITTPNTKGVVAIEGFARVHANVWQDDVRFVKTYWEYPWPAHLQHLRLGIRDESGYYFILGAPMT